VIVPRTVNPEPSPTVHRVLVRVDDFPAKARIFRCIPLWVIQNCISVTGSWP
jgi:hypothetical protein